MTRHLIQKLLKLKLYKYAEAKKVLNLLFIKDILNKKIYKNHFYLTIFQILDCIRGP